MLYFMLRNKKIFQNTDGIANFLDSLDFEKAHIKFCKFLLGVNKSAVILAVNGSLLECVVQAFKYWYYHIHSSNNLLILREALAVSEDLYRKVHLLGFHSLQVYAK